MSDNSRYVPWIVVAVAAFILARACDRSFREGRSLRLRRGDGSHGVTYELTEAV